MKLSTAVAGFVMGIAIAMFVVHPLAAPQSAGAMLPASAMLRTADGKPDLSGIWQVVNTAAWNIEPHHASKDVPAGQGVVVDGAIPYQPWALEKRNENVKNRATADPESKCYLPGVPRIMFMPYPFQIVQTPKQIAMLYEYVHATRNVYMDSKHPPGPIDWWMGDSRASWDGDTLVVDVVHFNEETWFDRAGNFHSDAMHLVERYTPMSRDHIQYEVTVEDPKVFTRPWKMSMPLYRRMEKQVQVLEYECYAFDGEEFHVTPP
jgi:hypothetical protein